MRAPARKALGLLPPCATTGIGSLPHTQAELALQRSLQHDVPFLPQLPTGRPAELMIPAALEGFPGVSFDNDGSCFVDLLVWAQQKRAFGQRLEEALGDKALAAFEPSADACRSFRPFLWEIEQRKLPFAKVQIAGPATVRWFARTSSGRPLQESPELDQQVFRMLMAKSLALVAAVRRAGATPILYLDEPGLYALDTSDVKHVLMLQELKVLIAAVQQSGALVGLHCCSNTDWAATMNLGLDILSVDARLSLDAVVEDQAAFTRFLASGATLSLGIIPTDIDASFKLEELFDSVEAALRATLPTGIDGSSLVAGMLLTPACGMAMRSMADTERILEAVQFAQRHFRRAVA